MSIPIPCSQYGKPVEENKVNKLPMEKAKKNKTKKMEAQGLQYPRMEDRHEIL